MLSRNLEFVGVKRGTDPVEFKVDGPSLKSLALMFDRLAMPGINAELAVKETLTPFFDEQVAEYRWLQERGFIFEPNIDGTRINYADSPDAEIFRARVEAYVNEMARFFQEKGIRPKGKRSHIGDPELRRLLYSNSYAMDRLIALHIRDEHKVDAVPIFYGSNLVAEQADSETEDLVFSVVINSLPTVDADSVSWEQIFEFRSDSDSTYKFLEFRHWMKEVSTARVSLNELTEKLEFLIHQYVKHLALHKIKAKHNRLETFIVSTLEAVEELIRLRPSKAVAALFRVRGQKIVLLEEELKLPGHEIAYLIDLDETFRPR